MIFVDANAPNLVVWTRLDEDFVAGGEEKRLQISVLGKFGDVALNDYSVLVRVPNVAVKALCLSAEMLELLRSVGSHNFAEVMHIIEQQGFGCHHILFGGGIFDARHIKFALVPLAQARFGNGIMRNTVKKKYKILFFKSLRKCLNSVFHSV